MTSCQVTVFITAIANIIGEEKSVEEVTLLSAMLVQLGDTLATIAVIKEGMEAQETPETN